MIFFKVNIKPNVSETIAGFKISNKAVYDFGFCYFVKKKSRNTLVFDRRYYLDVYV